MSKKAGKKQKASKVPEIDPDSPEWQEEVARKQDEAYNMVQRAMIRSQIEVMLTTRDDLMRQKSEVEAKMEHQCQDQNDIYQYLRKKLKDNYVAIAELETKVLQAHDDRLKREKELIAAANELDEKRKSEKARLTAKLEALEVDVVAIKEFQENSASYAQKLRDLEATIADCKEKFRKEVELLNSQIEEEWETGRKDKEERIKITKKAAAKATQEQLGPRTQHMIAQNKKMMSELRFQCFEVEKMQRTRQGLLKTNTLLLAQAASARHGVETLARRSHLLQRIIRYMHQKLQTRTASRSVSDIGGQGGADRESGAGAEVELAVREAGRGGNGTLYKLAGMSEDERQQMLDLREELRRKEVAIAAVQALVGVKGEGLRKANGKISRVLVLKADLARVLALCHEDPLLSGINDGSSATSTTRGGLYYASEHSCRTTNIVMSSTSSSHDGIDPATLGANSGARTRPFPNDTVGRERGEEDTTSRQGSATSTDRTALPTIKLAEHQRSVQQRQRQQQCNQATAALATSFGATPARGAVAIAAEGRERVEAEGGRDDEEAVHGLRSCKRRDEIGGGLPVWPENAPLPTEPIAGRRRGNEFDRGGYGAEGGNRAGALGSEVLKAVSRLFLSKLQVAVEPITPRTPVQPEMMGLPASGGVSSDGDVVGVSVRRTTRKSLTQGNRKAGRKGGIRSGVDGMPDAVPANAGRGGFNLGFRDSTEDDGREGPTGGSRRGVEDATSIWSDRQTTGIPSWDMLEPAVRQTKRRRTREAASQTLTYRELRDHATAASISSTRWKGDSLSSALTHIQTQTHAALADRWRSTPAPNSSFSLATASGASVYRVTDGGGIVHGAVVRGGGYQHRKDGRQPPVPQHGRIGRRGAGEGNKSSFKADVRALAKASGANDKIFEDGAEIRLPSGQDGGAPSLPQQQRRQSLVASPLRKPETIDTSNRDHRLSPPVVHVSVSWGDVEDQAAATKKINASQRRTDNAKEPAEFEHEVWNAEYGGRGQSEGRWYGADGGTEFGGSLSGSGNGGERGRYTCNPLSKGPDYRKVLLFTVDDDDLRILRRPPAPSCPTATEGTAPAGVPFLDRHKDAASGITNEAGPDIGHTAFGAATKGSTAAADVGISHLQQHRLAAASAMVKPSTAAAGMQGRRGTKPRGYAGKKGLLRGISRGNGNRKRGNTRGVVTWREGGFTTSSNVWDSGMERLDEGPSLCSVSTLSGGDFEAL